MQRLLVSLVILLATVTASRATTLKYKDFDQLVAEASAVVEGTVSRIRSTKVADGDFYTFVTISDVQVHKGRYGAKAVTLRLRGGTVGDERHVLVGSPQFAKGERVVAFVSANGRAMVPLVGWEQGLFRIEDGKVIDSRGNFVVGIDNARVSKRPRLAGRAEALDGAARTGFSRDDSASSAKGSAGRADDGSTDAAATVVAGAGEAPAMSRDAFVAAIGESAGRAAAAAPRADAPALVSVERAPPPRGDRAAIRGSSASPAAARSGDDGRPRLPARMPATPPTDE